uniref:Uncharacterized protein n=1 Tax=Micrurus lemniscatus lemniscatus TaxID=129467 RepID=A0A2D4IX04_MICLE
MGEKMAKTEPSFREMEHYLFLNDTHYFLRTIGKVAVYTGSAETDQERFIQIHEECCSRNLFTQATDQSFSGTLLPSATFLWNRPQKNQFFTSSNRFVKSHGIL